MNKEDSSLYIVELLRPVLAEYASDELVPRDAAIPLLSNCLDRLEREMGMICSRYSRLRLLMLVRTLCPPWIFTGRSPNPFLDIGPHRVLTAVALKHGGSVLEGSLMGPLNGQFRITEQEKADCGQLSVLAQYYSLMERTWYAFGHGAGITVREGWIDLVGTEEQATLGRIENRRLDQNGDSILAPSAMLGIVDLEGDPSHSSTYALLAASVVRQDGNYGQEPLSMGVPEMHGGRPFPMNFVSVLYGMHEVESLMHLYRSDFATAFGLTPDEYLTLLTAMSWLQVDGNVRNPEFLADFCRTGLGLFERQPTLEFLACCYERSMPMIATSSSAKVQRFAESVVLSERLFRSIELHGRWIPYLLYQFGDLYVADWSNLPLVLNNLLTTASQSATGKNARGARLEVDLADWIRSKGHDPQTLFRPNQKLRLRGKVVGEVDLSYARGAVAYIVECKAYTVSRFYYRGDPHAVYTRRRYSEKWLSQVIRTAQRLAANPIGDNYRLPDAVRYIVPLVCSLNIEPISSMGDRHLVSEHVPRICTPGELLTLLDEDLDPSVTPNEYTFSRCSPSCSQ